MVGLLNHSAREQCFQVEAFPPSEEASQYLVGQLACLPCIPGPVPVGRSLGPGPVFYI